MQSRTGIYYWAGPGTVRMIRLKFFHPKIDTESILRGYDADVLKPLQNTLNLTDAWVTYSWGFSEETEEEDRAFLRLKLENFRQAGMRTHAYVQGTNLVFAEHKSQDLWCRDDAGKLIPYHRGRKLCCPNNPAFRQLLLSRVENACTENVDGVFVDNFHFGQFPVGAGGFLTFFGCACTHCRALFRAQYGHDIPRLHRRGDTETEEYISFRHQSLHALARDIRRVTQAHGKEFGSNSFDQNLDAKLMYGFDVSTLADIQDYLLFENFNHPALGRGNAHHKSLIDGKKPVFIVSYKRVIGKHTASVQRDIDAVFTESQKLGYAPCYKGSEFTTNNIWHGINPASIRPPQIIKLQEAIPLRKKKSKGMLFAYSFTKACNALDVGFLERVYETKRWRRAMGWVIDGLTSRQFAWKPSFPRTQRRTQEQTLP